MKPHIQSSINDRIITFKPVWKNSSQNKNKKKKTRQLVFYIAGLKHHEGVSISDDLVQGEAVRLQFEDDNPFDDNAIAIYARGQQMGYVPAKWNYLIAEIMDQNLLLTGEVLEVFPNRPSWKRVKIKLEMVFDPETR